MANFIRESRGLGMVEHRGKCAIEVAAEKHVRRCLNARGQLREDVKQLDGKVDDVRLDVAGLKIRASVWGAVAGMIPAAIAIIWHFLQGRTTK